MTTYECRICLNINHVSRFQCQTCGTIPECYSVLKTPLKYSAFTSTESFALVTVVVAYGADRAEHHKTSRSYLRTVPVDYYASE